MYRCPQYHSNFQVPDTGEALIALLCSLALSTHRVALIPHIHSYSHSSHNPQPLMMSHRPIPLPTSLDILRIHTRRRTVVAVALFDLLFAVVVDVEEVESVN